MQSQNVLENAISPNHVNNKKNNKFIRKCVLLKAPATFSGFTVGRIMHVATILANVTPRRCLDHFQLTSYTLPEL